MHPTTEHRTISTRKHQLHHPKPHPRNRKRLPLRGPATPRKSPVFRFKESFQEEKDSPPTRTRKEKLRNHPQKHPVPHPCAAFWAQGWDTSTLNRPYLN